MAKLILYPNKVRLAARVPAELLVRKTAGQIERAAKRRAASGKYVTGSLSSRITVTYKISAYIVRAQIGPKPTRRYDLAAHQGAKPHRIRPKRRGGKLRFYWRKVGHVVYFSSVSHPGMRGKEYLIKPLHKYGRRNGFRVVTLEPKVR